MNDIFTPPAIDKATQALVDIYTTNDSIFNFIYTNYLENYKNVWDSPYGVSPDLIITAMGTNAVALFTQSFEIATFINKTITDFKLKKDLVPMSAPDTWNLDFSKGDGSIVATLK